MNIQDQIKEIEALEALAERRRLLGDEVLLRLDVYCVFRRGGERVALWNVDDMRREKPLWTRTGGYTSGTLADLEAALSDPAHERVMLETRLSMALERAESAQGEVEKIMQKLAQMEGEG